MKQALARVVSCAAASVQRCRTGHVRVPLLHRLALTLVLCAAALGWFAGRAAAHAFPTSFGLLFDASNPARMVVLLRPGLVLTEDGGRTWDFLCGAVSGIAGDEAYPALLADQRLLVGAYVGLYRDDGFGCGWSRVENGGLPTGRILDLAAGEDGSVEALVALAGGGAGLFSSRDHGQSWSAPGARLPAEMPRELARAASDPRRRYLLDSQHLPDTQPTAAVLWVSDDAGAHWVERAHLPPECTEILAVDPGDADRSYVRCGDRVLVSADAGQRFETWAEVPQIGGFAIAPDASSRWVGSRSGGLWREDGDGKLQLLHAGVHVGCLQFHSDALWVCARDERGYDAYALATSRDGGKTLTPFLRSVQVSRLRSCGNAQQAASCNSEWYQWQADVALGQPPDAGQDSGMGTDAGVDAGPEPASTAPTPPKRPRAARPDSGCAVRELRVSGSASSWVWMWLIVGVILAVRARRRSRSVAP